MSNRLEVETVEPDTKTDVRPVVDSIAALAHTSTSWVSLVPVAEDPLQLGDDPGVTKQIPMERVLVLIPESDPREATTLHTASAVAAVGPPLHDADPLYWYASREMALVAEETPLSIDM
jgi:hypothetical protein